MTKEDIKLRDMRLKKRLEKCYRDIGKVAVEMQYYKYYHKKLSALKMPFLEILLKRHLKESFEIVCQLNNEVV